MGTLQRARLEGSVGRQQWSAGITLPWQLDVGLIPGSVTKHDPGKVAYFSTCQ